MRVTPTEHVEGGFGARLPSRALDRSHEVLDEGVRGQLDLPAGDLDDTATCLGAARGNGAHRRRWAGRRTWGAWRERGRDDGLRHVSGTDRQAPLGGVRRARCVGLRRRSEGHGAKSEKHP